MRFFKVITSSSPKTPRRLSSSTRAVLEASHMRCADTGIAKESDKTFVCEGIISCDVSEAIECSAVFEAVEEAVDRLEELDPERGVLSIVF